MLIIRAGEASYSRRSPLQGFLLTHETSIACDAGWLLRRELEAEDIEKHAVVFFWLGVACEDQATPISCREENVKHLEG